MLVFIAVSVESIDVRVVYIPTYALGIMNASVGHMVRERLPAREFDSRIGGTIIEMEPRRHIAYCLASSTLGIERHTAPTYCTVSISTLPL